MTDLLVQNNISSVLCVLASWWLAHQSARRGGIGRLSAVASAFLGLSILVTGFARNLDLDPRPLIIATKYILAFLLASLAFRNNRDGLDR
ncbi:hypothetical protein [Pseudooceanicola nitratireducens]|jgi:hypothetical protein|uniref:hypothetical protein n=1 Tax=Pseudooceanicola nitratireducens TaxID=517719 RepID=UPI003C7DAB46